MRLCRSGTEEGVLYTQKLATHDKRVCTSRVCVCVCVLGDGSPIQSNHRQDDIQFIQFLSWLYRIFHKLKHVQMLLPPTGLESEGKSKIVLFKLKRWHNLNCFYFNDLFLFHIENPVVLILDIPDLKWNHGFSCPGCISVCFCCRTGTKLVVGVVSARLQPRLF